MHIHRLRLHRYGQFEDKLLSFAAPGKLSLVYGPNEAGKSTALYALEAFLFGLMDRRVAVTYEQAWTKSQLKITGWLSSSDPPESLVELQRSHAGVQDRLKVGAEAWLPSKDQRGLFKDLFALDGERLRAEASRVLATGGSASQALGAALLGEQAEAQCKRLEEQAEALYKPRGRNQTINALRAELEALDKTIAEQSLSAEAWLGQERAAEEAQKQAQALEEQRQTLRQRQAMLARDAKRLSADQKLADLRAEWAELQGQHPGLPALTSEELASLAALERERSGLLGAMRQRQEEMAQLAAQSQALHLDAGLWQAHEAAMATLGHGYEEAGRWLEAWRALQASRPAGLLAHDGSTSEAAQAQQRDADTAQAAQCPALDALLDQAASLAPVPDEPGAPEVAPTLSAFGLGLEELRDLLRPEQGLAQSFASWRAAQQDLRQDAQTLAVETRAGERALQEAAIASQHLQDQGAGLDSGPLLEARRHRDQLWSNLKRDPGQASLQEAFEAALAQTDRLAEAFARSERQAGAWQHAQRQQAEASLQVTACQARATSLAQREAALSAAITKALAITPEPENAGLEALLGLAEAVLASQAPLQAAQRQQEAWRASLARWQALSARATALGFVPRDGAALDREVRAWLKSALEDARAAQARVDKQRHWQGFRDREAALSARIDRLLQQADDQGLASQLGHGLVPVDRLALLVQAFEQERKLRQDQARLTSELARQTRAQNEDQAQLAALDDKRLALVPAELKDLALLHSASKLQASIAEETKARASLGDFEGEGWGDGEGGQSLAALDEERQALEARDQALDAELRAAHQLAGEERQALRALQQRDGARDLRFERAATLERLRLATRQYLDLGLQARVLRTALNRFLEQQQDALLLGASQALEQLTAGTYRVLEQRRDQAGTAQFWVSDALGDDKALEQLSEGTKDQLYLGLRLAALDQYGLGQLATQAGAPPLICDDLLVQFDDARAARALTLLAERRDRQQVIYFTHHKHLLELARQHLPTGSFEALDLSADQ